MSFRTSDATMFSIAVRNARLNRFSLSQIQAQIGSGKRLLSVADDPTAAKRILELRDAASSVAQFQRNIDSARSRLEPVETALSSLNDILTRLRELAVSADTEEDQFDLIKPEVEQLFAEVLRIANSRVGDRYLFAGFDTDTAPFTQVGAFVEGVIDMSVPPQPYAQYNGDNGALAIQVGEATTVTANATGRQVFFGSYDGDDTPDAGNVDIFDVIRDLRNRLEDPTVAGNPADLTANLDTALDQVLRVRGTVGANLNRLEITSAQLANLEISLETRRSAVEDLDFVEAASDLANLENTFQASLAVNARVLQPTLLNFLT